MKPILPFKATTTRGLGTSLTDIGSPIFPRCAVDKIGFQLFNAGTQAFADFALLVAWHKDSYDAGQWTTWISGSAWGTVAGQVKAYTGALNTLAASDVGQASLGDMATPYAFKFQAKMNSSTILTNGTFTGNANSWTLGTGFAYSSNTVAATTASATMKQAVSAMVSSGADWIDGDVYEISVVITNYSAGSLQCGTNTSPSQKSSAITANGTYTFNVTADDHADGLVFTGTGFTGTIDTISAKPCASAAVYGSMA